MFQLKDARKVVIIGGGATGVEQAGEVAHYYPDKQVTIIHSKDHLINDKVNSNFQKRLSSVLKNYNIKVLLGIIKFFFVWNILYE